MRVRFVTPGAEVASAHARVYAQTWGAVRAHQEEAEFIRNVVLGQRMLDLGSGPCSHLLHFPKARRRVAVDIDKLALSALQDIDNDIETFHENIFQSKAKWKRLNEIDSALCLYSCIHQAESWADVNELLFSVCRLLISQGVFVLECTDDRAYLARYGPTGRAVLGQFQTKDSTTEASLRWQTLSLHRVCIYRFVVSSHSNTVAEPYNFERRMLRIDVGSVVRSATEIGLRLLRDCSSCLGDEAALAEEPRRVLVFRKE